MSGNKQEITLLVKIAKAVGRYTNAEARTDYAQDAYRDMQLTYDQWCQEFRHDRERPLESLLREPVKITVDVIKPYRNPMKGHA